MRIALFIYHLGTSKTEASMISRGTATEALAGDGVPKAWAQQAAADSRGSRTCVGANTSGPWVAHAGG